MTPASAGEVGDCGRSTEEESNLSPMASFASLMRCVRFLGMIISFRGARSSELCIREAEALHKASNSATLSVESAFGALGHP